MHTANLPYPNLNLNIYIISMHFRYRNDERRKAYILANMHINVSEHKLNAVFPEFLTSVETKRRGARAPRMLK